MSRFCERNKLSSRASSTVSSEYQVSVSGRGGPRRRRCVRVLDLYPIRRSPGAIETVAAIK
jgi:hypothetical protein